MLICAHPHTKEIEIISEGPDKGISAVVLISFRTLWTLF